MPYDEYISRCITQEYPMYDIFYALSLVFSVLVIFAAIIEKSVRVVRRHHGR